MYVNLGYNLLFLRIFNTHQIEPVSDRQKENKNVCLNMLDEFVYCFAKC